MLQLLRDKLCFSLMDETDTFTCYYINAVKVIRNSEVTSQKSPTQPRQNKVYKQRFSYIVLISVNVVSIRIAQL